MNSFKLSQIREELLKIKDFDSLKSEVKKLLVEIEKFDLKKAIPDDKVKFIEKKYKDLMNRILTIQNQVEKDFDKAVKTINKRKNEAVKLMHETKAKALKQRAELEKMVKKNFNYFSKKAQQSIAKEEKELKKTFKRIRKTAVAKATKTIKKTTTKKKATR